MVFVHARNETVRTAMVLRETAKNNGEILQFAPPTDPKTGDAMKSVRPFFPALILLKWNEMLLLFTRIDSFQIHCHKPSNYRSNNNLS